jgi:phospholipid/cholesterol/gamma-HCH transport system ATP-binding protein
MMENPAPAIAVEGLTCGYDRRVILRDVTFTVSAGEIFFVIGGSGCGKSTLLRHMIGLLRPFAGAIRYSGRSFADADFATRRELLRTFGVLFQSAALWSSLTLRENVALPLAEHTRLSPRDIGDLARLKLEQVGLAGYEDFFPAELSGGMKKRAGLARALALDPAIVFFDEPSAGLDPVTSREIDELILQVRDRLGTTCVVVSHELDSIFRIGDRLIMLDRTEQGIIARGSPAELRERATDLRVRSFLDRGVRPEPPAAGG